MKHLYLFMLAMACMSCIAAVAAAQVPPTLSYQGVLTDASGMAVPDGQYSITFRIYDVASGSSHLWAEFKSVEVHKGIFNVILGEVTPFALAFDKQYWLGISVAGQPELLPRTQLTSSPYSLNAREVNGEMNLFPSTGYVGIGIKAPATPLHIETDNINGLRIDGLAVGAWASVVLNAQGANSAPSFEYYRQNTFKARTYVDYQDDWKLVLGGDLLISAMHGSRRVGIGVSNPAEQLDVNGAIKLAYTGQMNAGTIRWTGSDFEGYDGASWKSFTAGGGGLPAGVAGQTLRHDGGSWIADNNIYNDGTNVGIGTTSPQFKLHVNGLARFELPTGQISVSTPGGWPGIIAYSQNGNRRDIVFDDDSMWLSASPSPSAPSADNGIVLRSSGNIGIGTYDPAEKLHVVGFTRFDVGSGQIYVHHLSDSPNIAGFAPNGHRRDILFDDQGLHLFASPWDAPGGISRGISIDEEGNVAIGSGSHPPQYGLNVNRAPTGGSIAVGGHIGGVTTAMAVDVAVVGRYESASDMGVGVYGEASTSSSGAAGVYGAATGSGGFGVYSDGDFATIHGTKSAIVETADYGARKLYCLESAGNYFEDFGQGQLVTGEVTVAIDPVFAQTVNLSSTYHVFLTPMGDCGLYVAAKTPNSFTVRALDGKQVNIAFDYRIVAKRAGYEGKRLEPVEIPAVMTRR